MRKTVFVITLKHLVPFTWLSGLRQDRRVVRLVGNDRIDFIQARYHY